MRKVGSGITERRKPDLVVATPENVLAFFRGIGRKSHEAWGGYADTIAFARSRFEQIKARAPSIHDGLDGYNSSFVERVTEGWYVHSIVIEADIAERAIAEDRPWEAVACAMRIGELLTELRMKQIWEPDALLGKKHREKSDEGAAMRRKRSREERVAAVEEIVARGRVSKRKAFALVAKQEGSSANTIQADYYAPNKKRPKPAD